MLRNKAMFVTLIAAGAQNAWIYNAAFGVFVGPVVSNLPGNRATGDLFTHDVDCLIQWTQTALPAGADRTIIELRKSDADNYFQIKLYPSGEIEVAQIVATVTTAKGYFAGPYVDGDVISMVSSGLIWRTYVNSTLIIERTDMSVLQTNTGGKITNVGGASGIVTNLVTYKIRNP